MEDLLSTMREVREDIDEKCESDTIVTDKIDEEKEKV